MCKHTVAVLLAIQAEPSEKPSKKVQSPKINIFPLLKSAKKEQLAQLILEHCQEDQRRIPSSGDIVSASLRRLSQQFHSKFSQFSAKKEQLAQLILEHCQEDQRFQNRVLSELGDSGEQELAAVKTLVANIAAL